MHVALLVLILLFALLGHGYFWIGIVNRLHGWPGPHRLVDVLTLVGLLLFLVLPVVVVWQIWTSGSSFLAGGTSAPIWYMSRTYVLTMVFVGLGNLLARAVGGWCEDDPRTVISKSRRVVDSPPRVGSQLLVGTYSRLLALVPYNQILQLAVDEKRLVIPRLPPELSGLRIAHVSDFHLTGRIARQWYVDIVDAINSQGADVIMITGDIIENESCHPWLNELGSLRAKYGVYFVLGNHDFYIDADRTVSDLTKLGLIHMGGKSLTAKWNNYPVVIAGNELPWRRELPDLTAFDSLEPRPFRLILMHTPDQFDWACASRADLALAGHTHGGQVCFPILGAVASPSLYGTRFAGGTFKRGNTVMHVTRGISGETPMRWLCPPEIAVLELVQSR